MNTTTRLPRPFFHPFRFNSVFFKTFLTVFSICLLFLGSFSFYFLKTENASLQKNAEASYMSMLQTASTATELSL